MLMEGVFVNHAAMYTCQNDAIALYRVYINSIANKMKIFKLK